MHACCLVWAEWSRRSNWRVVRNGSACGLNYRDSMNRIVLKGGSIKLRSWSRLLGCVAPGWSAWGRLSFLRPRFRSQLPGGWGRLQPAADDEAVACSAGGVAPLMNEPQHERYLSEEGGPGAK